MEEVWKCVKDYEGLYRVSNLGRVKSLSKIDLRGHLRNEKILKLRTTKQGYSQVGLHKDGKETKFLVHQLVAKAFIPNPNNYPIINHKKEFEKSNNTIDNLEWCTYKYNANYGTYQERRIKSIDFTQRTKNIDYENMQKCRRKKVYQYKGTELIKEWNSILETKKFGFQPSQVSECCNKVKGFKTHRGYTWSFNKLEIEQLTC
jgi:hypothetical protein